MKIKDFLILNNMITMENIHPNIKEIKFTNFTIEEVEEFTKDMKVQMINGKDGIIDVQIWKEL